MNPMLATRPRVKICCIKTPDEAALAIQAGASALGLVSWMPSGPGVVDVPIFLAGGLNSTNVTEAIAAVQPFGLHLCSGVRTDDRLDPVKLAALFDALSH